VAKSKEVTASGQKLSRRELLRRGAGLTLTPLAAGVSSRSRSAGDERKKVRIGMVGVGHRGTALLRTLLRFGNVEINALADITPGNLAHAQSLVEQERGKRPEGYGTGPEDFRKLVLRDDLDAVIGATPWAWHAPIAVASMKAGKHAGIEVPAATTLEECWDLVNTSEATGVPCMMLENVCYFRDMLMLLNMVRQGVLGELTHCAAGYQHDCRAQCFDENGNFSAEKFAPTEGSSAYQLWYTLYALSHNGNLYPTHPIGPVAQCLNINRGDLFTYLVSMSSKSRGLSLYVKERFGPDHENAQRHYAQGDINTTLIKTRSDCTVVLYYDSHSPRPYDLGFRVQGTNGLYMMTRDSIYIEVKRQADTWEAFDRYRQKYGHPLWKKLGEVAETHGHRGADYITLYKFIQAVRNRTTPEVDVYDAASWSSIMPLSESSVAQGSAPVEFPDFTRGKWKSRSPLPVVSD